MARPTDPNLTMRKANKRDLDFAYRLYEQIQAIHADAEPKIFKRPQEKNNYAPLFSNLLEVPNGNLLIAENNSEAIGLIYYLITETEDSLIAFKHKRVQIEQVVVSQQHRGKGYGTYMIEYVKRCAKSAGAKRVQIDAWTFNETARICYKKAGFNTARKIMFLEL
ncbi:GNAT family N-acetyltransferase [Lentilitoribacter sp. Alg239-R112]|uniref:GNAT family N-acetyltransferase n=1 Tax=Lentilitoribacter sp. Alg239-R112 TaxID=2305987 RepID=UPI0013A6F4E7|nr:GNAT family N-acetyltransferase [Lentilitoribacter sp. Alg239-R112]